MRFSFRTLLAIVAASALLIGLSFRYWQAADQRKIEYPVDGFLVISNWDTESISAYAKINDITVTPWKNGPIFQTQATGTNYQDKLHDVRTQMREFTYQNPELKVERAVIRVMALEKGKAHYDKPPIIILKEFDTFPPAE